MQSIFENISERNSTLPNLPNEISYMIIEFVKYEKIRNLQKKYILRKNLCAEIAVHNNSTYSGVCLEFGKMCKEEKKIKNKYIKREKPFQLYSFKKSQVHNYFTLNMTFQYILEVNVYDGHIFKTPIHINEFMNKYFSMRMLSYDEIKNEVEKYYVPTFKVEISHEQIKNRLFLYHLNEINKEKYLNFHLKK
jgi:hypothetical protein